MAGPVTVAALALPSGLKIGKLNGETKFRDSKKLSPRQREILFRKIKESRLPFAIASVSPEIIDKINVSNAANLAARRALLKLAKNREPRITNSKVMLDGGLYLPESLNSGFSIFNSIVKGDEKILAVALASVVAKVTRDRRMKKLHKKYPRYDFMNNAGYGTQKHVAALKKSGLSAVHRRSFRIR